MSYVHSVLQPGETVRFQTNLHWVLYVPGIAVLVLAGVVYWLAVKSVDARQLWTVLSVLLLAVAFVLLFTEWFQRWTTEVAVTSRRIIHKRGFIRRQTKEIALDKVESVDVTQSVLGRILDYGTIEIHGTGTATEPLSMIASPIEFRNHVTAEPT